MPIAHGKTYYARSVALFRDIDDLVDVKYEKDLCRLRSLPRVASNWEDYNTFYHHVLVEALKNVTEIPGTIVFLVHSPETAIKLNLFIMEQVVYTDEVILLNVRAKPNWTQSLEDLALQNTNEVRHGAFNQDPEVIHVQSRKDMNYFLSVLVKSLRNHFAGYLLTNVVNLNSQRHRVYRLRCNSVLSSSSPVRSLCKI